MPHPLHHAVAAIEGILECEGITPQDTFRRIVGHLIDGGSGRSIRQFIAFLTLNSRDDDLRCEDLDPKTVGHWKRGQNVPPAHRLQLIVRVYNDVVPGLIDRYLASRLEKVRLRAAADKSGRLLQMFNSRDLSKVRHHDSSDIDGVASTEIYSYWRVAPSEAAKDLDDFVALSHNEPGIRESHDAMGPHERRRLYRRWLALEPRAFMTLRKHDVMLGTSKVVAVSIILPLSPDGASRIRSREIDAVELTDQEIGTRAGVPSNILIDTWIVATKGNGSGIDHFARRHDHDGYGMALLPLHMSLFWDGEQHTTVLVEPDARSIRILCDQLGFDDHRDCFALTFADGPRSPIHSSRTLAQAVQAVSKWPIMNGRG